MLENIKKKFLILLPNSQYSFFQFLECLIRKHYHWFFYYFTKIYEIVHHMIVTILWTIFFKNILSALARIKLFELYLYSFHKRWKLFLFNKERHKHQIDISNLRKNKTKNIKKIKYSGGILTMCTQWRIASIHYAS